MSKILIISPVTTHPPSIGNKARILDLCMSLQEAGYDIDFFYIHKGMGSGIEETRDFFGKDNFYACKSKHRNYWSLLHGILYRLVNMGIYSPTKAFNYSVDYWYDPFVARNLEKLINKNDYKAVFVEYVVNSKYFELFPKKVVKIIDTLDKFEDRWRIFYEQSIIPYGYSMNREEEGRGLDRADMIIAIQNREADYFKATSTTRLITYGYKIHNKIQTFSNIANNLLYIGSNHPLNNKGLVQFLNNSFPLLAEKYPDLKFFIGGSVCGYLEKEMDLHPNIELLGFVERIEDFYNEGEIVINTIPSGRGLKIKSIEALSFSKYLVSTPCGIEGLESEKDKSFFVANNPNEFVKYISLIIDNEQIRKNLKNNIKSFIKNYNFSLKENFNELVEFIELEYPQKIR